LSGNVVWPIRRVDFAATLTSLTAVAEIEEANRSRWI
jgi:hypothetical protein